MTEFIVMAKPIEWALTKDKGGHDWYEPRYGFIITYYPNEEERYRYVARCGEGQPNNFATLPEAKQWCQDSISEWVRDNVTIEKTETK